MNTLRVFNHYIHVKFLMLGAVQFVFLVFSVYWAALLRFIGQTVPLTDDFLFLLPKAVIFAATIILCLSAMGLYRPQRQNREVPLLVRVVAGFVLAWLTLSIAFYVIPGLYLGRGVLALATLLALIVVLVLQLAFYLAVDQRQTPWRVLFYGAGANAASILAYMRRRSDQTLFSLVGCVEAEGETSEVDSDLIRKLDGSLLSYVRKHRIDEIVVAMDDRRHNFPADQLIDCRIAGVNVIDTLTFYERQTGKVKTDLLSPSWIIFSYGFRRNFMQESAKRTLDVVVSALMLLVFSPFMIATALAIMMEDGFRQPVFFSQRRVGRQGRDFMIYKFRSMRTDAEASGVPQWATEEDPRVTRVGHYIRKYRLDELPQIINVLRGDMSLVGPRPERPEFVAQLSKSLPYYEVRECVKPGITGWAQLGYPYGASEDDAKGKLQLDLYYVKNRSLFLDLIILIGTCEVIMFRKGSR
ncbi:TIGR03013 family XrtA/PEP-CTERM system glycosyltransferase [Salinisphaera aquimarina]|uniref:TIGR03013 family XrtA/PEP-CTERM system glycosyltransferase n=1 Tax=Salinisphaera aquimarina TaxID=2094031 RepID=A0ABV7EQ37_9GAMM